MLLIYAIAFVCIQVAVAAAQDIPEECRKPPPFVEKPQECCKLPQVFSDEELEECGIKRGGHPPPPPPPAGAAAGGRPPFPGGPPHPPPSCDKHNCLLKKKDLLKEDESLDKEGLAKFLDKNKEDHPEFEKAIDTAKQRCLSGDIAKFGPKEICENIKIMFCVSSTLFMECPSWSDSEKCSGLREHLDKCKGALSQRDLEKKS